MPALPSFFPGRNKAKASATKSSPFSILRGGEPSTSLPLPPPVAVPAIIARNFFRTDVIEINNTNTGRYSLDFDGGKPTDEYEKALFDEVPSPLAENSSLPQVKLDIESPEALSDWFAANFLSEYPAGKAQASTSAGASGSRNEVGLNASSPGDPTDRAAPSPQFEDGRDDASFSTTSSSEDVIANLQAMNPSHFGKLPGFDEFNRLPATSQKKVAPKNITIPGGSRHGATGSTDIPSSYRSPISTYDDTISSAVSGSTLARALLSNSFMLPSDSRSSRYRSGVVGLTRSDSTVLPRAEHSYGAPYAKDRFSIGPDAPPIPSNADKLYEPPKKPRNREEPKESKRELVLKRRSSTGSVANVKALPQPPTLPSPRPVGTLLTPGVEFDMNSIIQPTTPEPDPRKPLAVPRSPLPLPPTPKLPYLSSEDGNSSNRGSSNGGSSNRGSVPSEYQEAMRPFPLDSDLLSPDLNQLSPSASSEDGTRNGENLEDVLNYYSLPDSPDINPSTSFRPAFSPISEESNSQLSPPLSYKSPERRDSHRPVGARSPSGSPRARGESVSLPRRPSERNFSRQASLLSVAEQATVSQVSSPISVYSSSSKASSITDLLAPPPASTIFTRARSGNAPSPIKVIRDSKDATAYNITVSPQLLEADSPLEDGGNSVSQEFPETPNLFSPILTGGSGSPSIPSMIIEGAEVAPMPTVPLSATLPRGGSQSVAQQILLNRAGTTVRHGRQPSLNKIKMTGTGARSNSPSTSNRRLVDISSTEEEEKQSKEESASTSTVANDVPQIIPEMVRSASPEQITKSNRTSSVISARLSRASSLAPSISQGSDSSSMYTPSETSSRRKKSLPAIPGSPLPPPSPVAPSSISSSPSPSHLVLPGPSFIPLSMSTTSSTPSVSIPVPSLPASQLAEPVANPVPVQSFASRIPPPPLIPPPSPTPSQKARVNPRAVRLPPPALNISNVPSVSENTVAVNGPETGSPVSSVPSQPESNPVQQPAGFPNPNAPAVAHLREQKALTYNNVFGRDSDIFRATSLGSPPPYYQAVSDAIAHSNTQTPTQFPANTTFTFPSQTPGPAGPSTAAPAQNDWTPHLESRTPALARENSIISQRSRVRPPLPAGPRRPSQIQMNGLPSLRDRSASISSVGQSIRERDASPTYSPKFQSPAPKWRGYTMEAAKWTFTSAQLQAIVSRAIRQSAEASSIRLLRLEILDNDIPEEIQRLETQRTDLKNRYKTWARRRAALIEGLSMYMNGGDEEAPAYAIRMVDDLKEVTVMLDKFADELYNVNAQLKHLESLTLIHSGSALSMALRKLNSSFLKQVAENQVLRNQVQTLEAERNEAWQHAEDAANELDKMESLSSSRRSSRISAVRKSSVRVSKAGLRTPSQRLSQLSSRGSSSHPFGQIPRSPMARPQNIPPVPAIPRRRPPDLSTDIPNRSSVASPGYTPTSETRALIEAQDELYAMLGIKNPERPRRSRSNTISIMSGPSTAAHSSSQHAFPPMVRAPDTPASMTFRRSSLPGDSTLAEAYNAMAADRNAVLATIDMLSSTD
ncbi:hypothetical protein BDN70DRAFT_539768 [Pholiota conissans]|uniref:Uncharacterized protein n=1 Tax=Pholiota conissans TaxID=109636 RepID=A0A9P5ZFJ1_9AGAR|nr:hypothetical protein BDN70DRAFT_539768 [Pholiota conissans]